MACRIGNGEDPTDDLRARIHPDRADDRARLVALLLTIAVPRYSIRSTTASFPCSAKNLAAIRDALDHFYGDQGRYPDTLDDLVAKKYLRAIPVDPVTELPNWKLLAPEDGAQGKVYDIKKRRRNKRTQQAPPGTSVQAQDGARRGEQAVRN